MGEKFMEGKGDNSLARPDALPANGRKPGLKLAVTTVVTGIAVAGCGVLANFGISTGPKTGSSESPVPPPITSPNPGFSDGTELTTSPGTSPAVSPSVGPSQTPEVTPTLSPEAQLKQEIADYANNKKILPKTEGRFYLANNNGEPPALANVFAFNGVVDTDYAKGFVENKDQGYLFNEKVVKASDGKDYLVAYVVQESAKSSVDGKSEQYVLPIILGCETNSTDKDVLTTNYGVLASGSNNLKRTLYSISDMQAQIEQLNGTFVVFPLTVITGTNMEGYDVARSLVYVKIQNNAAEEVINLSKQTLTKPLSQIAQTENMKKIINQPVKDGFNIADYPMAVGITTQ